MSCILFGSSFLLRFIMKPVRNNAFVPGEDTHVCIENNGSVAGSNEEQKGNIKVLAHKEKWIFSIIIAICLGYMLLISGIFIREVNEMKKEIAKESNSEIQDVSFDSLMVHFRYLDARGIIVVYKIENNSYHSWAYWMPFGIHPLELWK